ADDLGGAELRRYGAGHVFGAQSPERRGCRKLRQRSLDRLRGRAAIESLTTGVRKARPHRFDTERAPHSRPFTIAVAGDHDPAVGGAIERVGRRMATLILVKWEGLRQAVAQ